MPLASTLVPTADRLPEVLPTDRLSATGKALPPVRDDLRRIPNARNAFTVAGAWAQTFGVIAAATAIDRWWAYLIAFGLMGRGFALLNILGHEAAHRLLFSRKALNDALGRWGLAYPGWVPFDVYRRAHMAHHKDEMGPNEPDLGLYSGYPITRASMRRKLTRDALGISGWKNLRPLLTAARKPGSRPLALRILGTQAAICAALTLGGGLLAGRWWLYPVLWLAPWMTLWRVSNRLRALAEHAGMARSDDRRQTTHVVRQTALARFAMVPYNTGWHLAHHVDPGIPWRNLPQFHRELVAAGWVTDTLTYRNYRALWKALVSAQPSVDHTVAPATA